MSAGSCLLPLTIRGVNLPKRASRRKYRGLPARVTNWPATASPAPEGYGRSEAHLPVRAHRYCVGADWIEFTATQDLDGLPDQPFLFSHIHSGHGTKYYNDLYHIDTIYHGEVLPFAELQMKPRPFFLDKNLVQVKIDNRFCYTPDIKTTIEAFCREYRLKFKNLTRLDLFADFQQVSGYETDIARCLYDCATRKLVLKGKSMRPHWQRNEVTGITWGSRSSGVSCTWYNKTAEMLKKSWKPWIEELWKLADFDMDVDVYRLEFSMKKPKVDIVTEEGETLCLNHDLSMLTKVKEIFDFCYQHHFQLAFNKEGERFSRLPRYYPIYMDATPYYTVTPCLKPKSNNYTKAYIKRLVVDAMFYQKKGECIESSMLYDHILEIVKRYSLSKWFDNKFHWLNLKKSHFSVLDVVYLKNPAFRKLQQRQYVQSELPLNKFWL